MARLLDRVRHRTRLALLFVIRTAQQDVDIMPGVLALLVRLDGQLGLLLKGFTTL